jgi:hypothetical protein
MTLTELVKDLRDECLLIRPHYFHVKSPKDSIYVNKLKKPFFLCVIEVKNFLFGYLSLINLL